MSLQSLTPKVLKSTDGTVIYAEAIGDPHKPSIVFIHGLGLSAITFDNLFEDKRLLDRYFLVRYDMRGHGRSGKPPTIDGYSSELYAADFEAVIKAFDIQKTVLLGWSMGATVAADVCAHLSPLPILGVVYLAALPYIGEIMGKVGTSTVLGFLPGLTTTDDATLASETKIAFMDSCFIDPVKVPQALKWQWIGMMVNQPPSATASVLSRPQDPTKLLEAGKNGLPMLVINGTSDQQVKGDVVVEEMKPHFKDLEVCMIDEGSHALHYDKQEEVVTSLISFVDRVLANGSK